MTDIVEILREHAAIAHKDDDYYNWIDFAAWKMGHAATEITRLRAEKEQLRSSLKRAQIILSNMAAEKTGYFSSRWKVNHEPLRADAKNLLPDIRAVLKENSDE